MMGSTAGAVPLVDRPPDVNLSETDPTFAGAAVAAPAAPKARDDDGVADVGRQSRAAQVMRLDPSLRSSLQYRAVDADDKWADDDDDDDEEGDGGGAGGAPPVFVNAVDRRARARWRSRPDAAAARRACRHWRRQPWVMPAVAAAVPTAVPAWTRTTTPSRRPPSTVGWATRGGLSRRTVPRQDDRRRHDRAGDGLHAAAAAVLW